MEYTYVGVVLVRTHDGAVLVQKRDNIPTIASPNTWSICGGRREATDHDDAYAAARELWEETGYKVRNDELCKLSQDEFTVGQTHIRRKFYYAAYDGIQPIHCFEGQKIVFVQAHELSKLDFCDELHREYVKLARENIIGSHEEGNYQRRK